MVDELVEDIREAIDVCMDQVVAVRGRLLELYREWPEDRPLGPAFDLGLSGNQSEFPVLRERLARRGGPGRLLQAIVRAESAFDNLADQYREGHYAATTVGAWRHIVEDLDGALAQALELAETSVMSWGAQQAAMEGPDSSVLKDKDYIFPEDFVRMWRGELSLDAARARISSGKYGVPIPMGKYNVLEKRNMRETLLRMAQEAGESDAAEQARELLKRLPKRRRSRSGGDGGAQRSAAGAPVPESPDGDQKEGDSTPDSEPTR